jgi:hypothetical protein
MHELKGGSMHEFTITNDGAKWKPPAWWHPGFYTVDVGIDLECPECDARVSRVRSEIPYLDNYPLSRSLDRDHGKVYLDCGCILEYRLFSVYINAYLDKL